MKNLLKKINGSKDLTEGNPMKLILNFGLPLLFGLLFQQFYNMVDTIIVGKFLGVDALAAVGSTGSINFMILGFCIGICNGFAIPVAQAFGAKDTDNMKKYITNCVWASIFFAAVMTVAVGILTRNILIWMKTPDSILDQAFIYIFIIFMGIPATFLYNMVSGILRSLGDSVTPVVCLIASSLLNIVLDILLVRPMGVAGAAVATVVAQAISGVGCLIYMCKKLGYLHFTKQDWAFSMRHCLTLCGMGVPMGLQYSITAIGSVVLQTGINTLGSAAVASVSAAAKLSMFLACPFDAIGSAMATYTGQNVGAGKIERIGQGLKASVLIGITYSILIFLVMLFSAKYWMLLFINASETEIIHNAVLFILANSGFYIALVFVNAVRFTIQGAGFSGLAILAGVMEMIARAIIGVIMVPYLGFASVCFASPLAWIMADCFLIPAYCHVIRKLKQRRAQGVPNM